MLMEQYRHERQLRKSVDAEVERLQLLVKSNLTEANLQRHTGEGMMLLWGSVLNLRERNFNLRRHRSEDVLKFVLLA